jgi:hypothetical protein
VIVCDATDTVPVEEVVNPAAAPVNDGADHPAGTTNVTAPLLNPPAAAVYVNVIVFPAEPADTLDVGVVNVPDPFAAYTVTTGCTAISANPPLALVTRDCVVNVIAPVVAPAVAVYVNTIVFPLAQVTPEAKLTVINDAVPATVGVPTQFSLESATVPEAVDHPDGTATVTRDPVLVPVSPFAPTV